MPIRRSRLLAAHQPMRVVPKTLTESQVEALLAAPDGATALGLRDRAMLELMYASGLRVSELVGLESVHLSLGRRAARHRQGVEGAARTVRRGGARLLARFTSPRRGQPSSAAGRATLFVTARGGAMTRQMFWLLIKKHARAAGITTPLSPHAAPCLRDAPAQPRRRPARGTDAARPRRHLDDPDLHPRRARAGLRALHAAHHPRG